MTWVEKVRASRWATLGVIVIPVLLLGAGLLWLATQATKSPAPKLPPADVKKPRRKRPRRPTASAAKPRAFISFAVEDEAARNLFVGQSRHSDTPFELADFSLHKPFDSAWKTQTRPRIKGCDVVVVLIGDGTHAAEGVLWEIKAAKEENVPLFGVYIDKADKGRMPGSLFGIPIVNWTWDGIAKQMRKAMQKSRAR